MQLCVGRFFWLVLARSFVSSTVVKAEHGGARALHQILCRALYIAVSKPNTTLAGSLPDRFFLFVLVCQGSLLSPKEKKIKKITPRKIHIEKIIRKAEPTESDVEILRRIHFFSPFLQRRRKPNRTVREKSNRCHILLNDKLSAVKGI